MISIAIATRNGEKYIEEQIRSICTQSILPNEIVISDDCSSDNTIQIIKKISQEYDNIKFNILCNQKPLGFRDNFFQAIKNCRGDYIFLSDQDDLWNKEKIKRMIHAFESTNDALLLFCDYNYVDKNAEKLKFTHEYFTTIKFMILNLFNITKCSLVNFNSFVKLQDIPGMCMLLKREMIPLIEEYLSINNKKILYAHDIILSYLAARQNRLYYLNSKLTNYRMHEKNTIGRAEIKKDSNWDRVKWLGRNLDNASCILDCELYVDKESENIGFLVKYIKNTIDRMKILSNKKIFKAIVNIFKLKYYQSFKSYFGDVAYALK